MAEQGIIRYGVLGVVAVLMAGLVWLGIGRYQAEQRTAQLSSAPAGQLATATADQAPAKAPEPASVPAPPEEILVHVAGAVAKPGLYKLPKGARVAEAITAAGGANEEGVVDALNLADRLEDGMKLSVPTKKELESAPPPPVQVASAARSAAPPAPGKVNLNTGTVAQFDALPGVTPTVAKNIVDYRTKNGPFKKIEDLDNVSGIGPATIEKLRPLLTL